MRIALKQLKKMMVETLSGTKLGKVQDYAVDDESMFIKFKILLWILTSKPSYNIK